MEPRKERFDLWAALPAAAVLSATANWAAYMRARRRGEDPSEEQQAPEARRTLAEDLGAARVLITRVRVLLTDLDTEEAVLRRVGGIYHGSRLVPVMHRVHQRLLSLYPAVDEALIEDVRLAGRRLDDALDGRVDLEDACEECATVLNLVSRVISG